MKIRPIKPEEAEAVSRIYALSWKTAYRGIVPQSCLDTLPLDRWVPALRGDSFQSLVLEEGGALIGTSGFSKARDEQYPGWGEIISLYLLPEHVGKRYGRALMEQVKDRLAGEGYNRISLWVLEDNHRARRFYQKHGFVDSGERMEYEIEGESLKELRYLFQGEKPI